MMSKAIEDVVSERKRQVNEEGWSEDHDDHHDDGELAKAAGCYCLFSREYEAGIRPPFWPWAEEDWKPKNYRRDLIRAAALVIAEIERLDR